MLKEEKREKEVKWEKVDREKGEDAKKWAKANIDSQQNNAHKIDKQAMLSALTGGPDKTCNRHGVQVLF